MALRIAPALTLVLSLVPAVCAAPAATPKPLVPRDGMTITKSVTLQPGTYVLPKGLVISADNITLDGNGATLTGKGAGQAVLLAKRKGVTITNLKISTYKWGIVANDCENLTIEKCRVRDTHEVDPDNVWLNIRQPADDPYGAAVLFRNVKDSRIAESDVQHQQNGISLYDCSKITVEKNNASFQSGWGIHLNNTSDSVIQDNLADWCDRIHKRGERAYYPGADAAGLLMVINSSRNKILRNMLRGGGDGVFIAGYMENRKTPCNDNLFEDNDCSYSPNNAFESTFCQGNIFRNNRANNSNYGFWLGYSWENVIENNEVRGNRIAGYATEHGYENIIRGNRFSQNLRGIALWSRSESDFRAEFPGTRATARNRIERNSFVGNGVGLLIKRDGSVVERSPYEERIENNDFTGNGVGAILMNARDCVVQGNRFQGNEVAGLRVEGSTGTVATRNAFVGQAVPAWTDQPVKWAHGALKEDGTFGEEVRGNYWIGKPSGPSAGVDPNPLETDPTTASTRVWTILDLWKWTPG